MTVMEPREIRKAAVAFCLLGLLFCGAALMNLYDRERRAFGYEAAGIREAVLTGINAGEAVAHGIRALFLSSENVDADEFRVFSEAMFERYPFIRSVAFSPRVFHPERAAFVRRQRERGFVTYTVHGGGERRAVPARDRYFPVLYSEPFSPRAAAEFGRDILTRMEVQEAVEGAIRSGMPVPTGPLALPGGGVGYELYVAVYEGKEVPEGEAARRNRANGLIAFSIDPRAFIGEERPFGPVTITLAAAGEGGSPGLYFRMAEVDAGVPGKGLGHLVLSHRLTVGEAAFLLTTETPFRMEGRDLLLFALGILAALLLAAGYYYFLKMKAHRRAAERAVYRLNEELESRVRERTAELKESLETLKRAQQQLVMSEKMAALGELVAGVAHEINTPVGIGITEASFLADRTAEVTNLYRGDRLTRSGMERYLDHCGSVAASIQTNLNRAGMLVRSFKQVAVDQSREERRRFNLRQYLEEVLLSLHARIKKGAHTVRLTCPPGLTIESYPGIFAQVLTNLVINALVHGFRGREEGRLSITAAVSEDTLVIDFADDGLGMEPETCRRIFDPFYTTRRGEGGTGLGMHIVYNLVVQTLGGEISCESRPGEGTAFHIRVPLNPPPPE